MITYKKCNVPTCYNDMTSKTWCCDICWDELTERVRQSEFKYGERPSKVSTHIPKHDKRHGPFGKCRVHDCEDTAHEQTKLCQSHQGAEKCCFDDCENITHRHWCDDCTEKREHALVIWERAGNPTYSSRNPNSIEFYNQQLKAKAELQKKAVEQSPKAEEKPIPSIKCRCCDNDRVRGSKECKRGHTGQASCDVMTCSDTPCESHSMCPTHADDFNKCPKTYEDFMSQFESEEDYRKSQEHGKKKDDMLTVNVDIDQEQLKKLGDKVQAAYEQQVRERMQGLQFDFIASPTFGPTEVRANGEIAAGMLNGAVGMSADRITRNPLRIEEARDEHKHVESCGQMALEKLTAAQASIEEQHQKEVDVRQKAHDTFKRSEVISQQEATMSKTNINTLPILKEDATDAAWRIAGKQFTKFTRDPIVAAIARGLGEDSEAGRAKVAAFLKTELGTAIYQGMLSTGLSFMPQATGDIPQKMARELRVSAMTSAGDQVADLLMEPLRQVATMYLSNAPQEVPALGQDTTSVKADVVIPVVVEAKR